MSRTHVTVVRERGPDTVVFQIYAVEEGEEVEIDRELALQWLIEPLEDNPFLPDHGGAATSASEAPLFLELARHAPATRPAFADNILGWLRFTHFLAWHARELVLSAEAVPQPPACPPGESNPYANALVTIRVREPSHLQHLRVGDLNDYSAPFGVARQFRQWEAALMRLSAWSPTDRESLRLHAECLFAYAPEHEGAHFALGEVHRVDGDFEAAIDAYHRSLAQRDDATAWARVSDCELALGWTDRALASAHRAVALDADILLGLLSRARAWIALGHLSEAATDLRRGLLLEPDATDVAELLATITK